MTEPSAPFDAFLESLIPTMDAPTLQAAVENALPPPVYDQRFPDTAHGIDGYRNCAYFAAQRFLTAARRDPELFGMAVEHYRATHESAAIDAVLPADEAEVVFDDLTGYQWGWAVSAALRLLEQPPIENPAILVLDSSEESAPA